MSITVAGLNEAADELAAASLGYSQGAVARRSHLDRKNRRIVKRKDGDCSMTCGSMAYVAGVPVNLADPFWTGNIVGRLVASGYYKRIKVPTSLNRNLKALTAFLKPGDTLRGPGHVIYVRSASRWWSAEHDERGKKSGGKPGWQKGEKVGYRNPYLRAKLWTEVARLISTAEFKGRILAAYSAGKSTSALLAKLTRRASWDGPRWSAFIAAWAVLDKGMALPFAAADVTVPAAGHAFVVLGSALNSDGTLRARTVHRLKLALAGLKLHPASRVLVSGGKPQSGVTEAAAMRTWLTTNGIAPDRILAEANSSSTVGNARYSLPILRREKIASYTLVSDASHLRRATVLFAAAQLGLETADNVKLGITATRPIAYNDYAPAPVATSRPVSAATRKTIAAEVAALLGLTKQYQSAL